MSQTPRAVPFYCPFCGEQDLRPAEIPEGGPAWHCDVCDRRFAVTFLGPGVG